MVRYFIPMLYRYILRCIESLKEICSQNIEIDDVDLKMQSGGWESYGIALICSDIEDIYIKKDFTKYLPNALPQKKDIKKMAVK